MYVKASEKNCGVTCHFYSVCFCRCYCQGVKDLAYKCLLINTTFQRFSYLHELVPFAIGSVQAVFAVIPKIDYLPSGMLLSRLRSENLKLHTLILAYCWKDGAIMKRLSGG